MASIGTHSLRDGRHACFELALPAISDRHLDSAVANEPRTAWQALDTVSGANLEIVEATGAQRGSLRGIMCGVALRFWHERAPMTRRDKWLWAGLISLLLVALAGYLHRNPSRYTETVDLGPSEQARANPYLAAERYLQGQRLKTVRLGSKVELARLPPRQTSLMLLGERPYQSPEEVDALLQWVRAGGRLLFVAEALWDDRRQQSADPLLDQLQLRQYRVEDLPPPPRPIRDPHPNLTKLFLENDDQPAYFTFDPQFHLEDPSDRVTAWANSAKATHLMQMRLGAGVVTVVTDADLWRNNAIARQDNVWLLWYLNQGRDVALAYQAQKPALLALLWQHFPQSVVALLLGGLLFAWHYAVRLGALLPAPIRARRQLKEYLLANAKLKLRLAGHEALLRRLREDILHFANRRHPGFDGLPVAEQWQMLAGLTRQPTRLIGDALRPRLNARHSSVEFCRRVAQLQSIRNSL